MNPGLHRRRILLVEDEAIIALNERQLLEQHDFAVVCAHSGLQAIEAFESAIAGGTPYDLVLMDIDLGSGAMDGIETARRVLERSEIPIVFLSSHTEPDLVHRAEQITSYGYVVKSSSPTVLIASIRMAFRLHEANRKADEREHVFRQLFEAMREGAVIYRAVDDGADFEIVDMNRAGLAYAQSSRGSLVGTRVTQAFPGVEKLGLLEVLRTVWQTGDPHALPLANYTDGRISQWLENYVFRLPSGLVVALYEDTTERHAREERYQTIIRTTMDGFCLFARDGRFLDVNQAYCEIVGYTRDELINMSIADIELAESEPEIGARIARLQARGHDRFETTHRHRNGAAIPVEVSTTFFPSAPEPLIVSFIRDIRERRAAELQREEAATENKQLLVELNHRVKNNLSMVQSLIALKDQSLGGGVLTDIQNQITAIQAIHESMLRSESIMSIRLRPYVDEILSGAFALYRHGAVTVENVTPDIALPTRTVMHLGLIINECATNAMKHGFRADTAARFSVSLARTDKREFAERAAHLNEAPETRPASHPHCILRVSNSGTPINVETALNARTESLGLRLIDALASQLHGNLTILAQPTTTFEIVFPLPDGVRPENCEAFDPGR